MHLKNNYVKLLFIHLIVAVRDNNDYFKLYSNCSFNEYLAFLVRDLCLAKLRKSFIPKEQKEHYMVITFENKYLDNISINSALHDNRIKGLFPINDDKLKTPGVAFKYTDTIRNKVVNYKQVIQEGVVPNDCECHSASNEYVDINSGHVFTGNLNIIRNNEIRNLCKKGLRFREVPKPNKEKLLTALGSGIQRYISQVSRKRNIPEVCFLPWKQELLKLLKCKVDKLEPYSYNNVLAVNKNSEELLRLQQKFVFIPTDKAGNNITVVCKKYYMESIEQEVFNSENFVDTNLTPTDVAARHTEFLKQYGLKLSGGIPFLYWTSKLHKNPFGKRFITSGKGGSLETLSINIGICLKTILKVILKDAKYQKARTGINKCFIINSRDPVIDFIKHSNMNTDINKTIRTFDFETLYTSIPQGQLKQEMASLIKNVFLCQQKGCKRKSFISVSGNHAYFAQKRSKSGFSVSFNELVKCINYLIDNSYIIYQGIIHRQVIGIPMGTNCAPYLANLYLHSFEVKFIEKCIRDGRQDIALKLNSVFRYQDDSIVFNDQDCFLECWIDIRTKWFYKGNNYWRLMPLS